MRKDYNVKNLKLKRRGILSGLEESTATNKVRITISLDKDIIDYFKSEAKLPGAFPYQTQINQALRKALQNDDIVSLKTKLLNDTKFINQLAKKIKQDQAKH